jgi:hypothetical protein
MVQPTAGELAWFVDQAAASKLKQNSQLFTLP